MFEKNDSGWSLVIYSFDSIDRYWEPRYSCQSLDPGVEDTLKITIFCVKKKAILNYIKEQCFMVQWYRMCSCNLEDITCELYFKGWLGRFINSRQLKCVFKAKGIVLTLAKGCISYLDAIKRKFGFIL